MEVNESSQYLRWALTIDTSKAPISDVVSVHCPVCGGKAHGSLYLNCIVPPVNVTLEEALTTAADEAAHRVLAEHLTQGACLYSGRGHRNGAGVLYPDNKLEGVFWLLRVVEPDDDPGCAYNVIQRWTQAEIDQALEDANTEIAACERTLRKARNQKEGILALAHAADAVECPF